MILFIISNKTIYAFFASRGT